MTSAHRVPLSGAEVKRLALPASRQVLQGQDVGLRKVGDMHVVANGGAVRRGVVGAIDLNEWTPPQRRLNRQRNQVGLNLMVFAQFAVAVPQR